MKPNLRQLPLLSPRADALEKCVYCPKLCRAACPVSNAEPSESLIPWGKMSAAYFMARGDVAITPESASVAWACTGCLACAERCNHKNPVAATLTDARADLRARRRSAGGHRARRALAPAVGRAQGCGLRAEPRTRPPGRAPLARLLLCPEGASGGAARGARRRGAHGRKGRARQGVLRVPARRRG